MTYEEREELDALYFESCKTVLAETLSEKKITEFGVCGVDLSKADGLAKLACAIG